MASPMPLQSVTLVFSLSLSPYLSPSPSLPVIFPHSLSSLNGPRSLQSNQEATHNQNPALFSFLSLPLSPLQMQDLSVVSSTEHRPIPLFLGLRRVSSTEHCPIPSFLGSKTFDYFSVFTQLGL
ncbi:hypothetical protein QQP08_020272 [Theobroma cacao]|nr:hypothetical protein QQP08_020272 [Theobroma cacao]